MFAKPLGLIVLKMTMLNKTFLCSTLSIIVIAVFFKSYWKGILDKPILKWTCSDNMIDQKHMCYPICPNGSFALPGMLSCHPWLRCGDKITLISTILHSVVKTIYLANWEGHPVVLSALTSKQYKDDFDQNLMMLKALGPHPLIVQLVGYCDNFFITQYHELGSALKANYHLAHSLSSFDSLELRLHLCISYASIIQYLHNSPVGVRVMCDSNTLQKTLSQYLLTNDFKIVINDLDATPKVSKLGVVCGTRELTGSFIAPEQLWPYSHKVYNAMQMPGYDEKTDIWKLPDVCNWFLGNSSHADIVKYKLFQIHKKCKDENSFTRPSAVDVVRIYQSVLESMKKKQTQNIII